MFVARNAAPWFVLAMLFAVGFVLMGFEMLGARYLNPYFGGGITTWASLISIVLLAMMVGYFAGGHFADRRSGVEPLSLIIALGGIMFLAVAFGADWMAAAVLDNLGDGFWGVLLASVALMFLPVALLSACSPYVVRLLLTELRFGGRVTGLVYSISTLGNVLGTLATTFLFIPEFGTRGITRAYGVALLLIAVLLLVNRRFLRERLPKVGAAALLLLGLVPFWPAPLSAGELRRFTAAYPEGPLWVGDELFVAEMGRHRIRAWRDGDLRTFWLQHGCGPTAIARYGEDQFAVNCHLGRKVVILDATGGVVREFTAERTLQDPNDINSDGAGGVVFSDSGLFTRGARATGVVYRIAADGTVSRIREGLHYANGVAFDAGRRVLYVSEHLARRVLQLDLDADYRVVGERVLLDEAALLGGHAVDYPETGPDGIRIDGDGNIYVAIYGAGLVVVLRANGTTHRVRVPMKFVTSVAVSEERIAVVGARDNRQPPFLGDVLILDRAHFLAADRVGFAP